MSERGKVRIIAGQWRGRKLRVPNKPGLRPTQDRMRETLFNWLAPHLAGSCCLDLFAGSGALGTEAASRGAKQVTLVEQDCQVVEGLKQQLVFAPNIQVVCADVKRFLQNSPFPVDIAFLDPPFGYNLVIPTCALLEQNGWLTSNAYIFLEEETHLGIPPFPSSWQLFRSQTVGQATGFLLRRNELLGEVVTR
jgi:16S rRNA (guanine966-N2)-methyltransferase